VKVPERSGAQAECLCHDPESVSCRSPWHGLQSVQDFHHGLIGRRAGQAGQTAFTAWISTTSGSSRGAPSPHRPGFPALALARHRTPMVMMS
jgi:hypothetical protein